MLIFLKVKAFLKFVAIMQGVTILTVEGLKMGERGTFQKFSSFLEKKGVFSLIKKVKQFPLENEHTTVLGLTRHGKTYATIKSLQQAKQGVLFFNVQQENARGFVKANKNNTIDQVIDMLKAKKKINYIPSVDLDEASKELSFLIKSLYEYGELDCFVAVDEVHIFCKMTKDKEGFKALQRIATTGLRFQYKAIFLSQRPAMVDNTLYSQSTQHIVFALGKVDESYLENHGFPVDEIVSKTKNEKYNFIVFDQKEVKGAFKIDS